MSSLLQQTWQTLMAHRMKSVLAIIAIAWGVISVVVLIALGEGFYRHQTQSFSFMINNVQVVFPSSTSKPWQGLPSRRQIDIPQEKSRHDQTVRLRATGVKRLRQMGCEYHQSQRTELIEYGQRY